jgi:hypothetical protein
MTQAQFEALKPGDLIRNWREPGGEGPVFTVIKRTAAGYSIRYPLPAKRTGRACTASAWELVQLS